ncbi:MAG: hypothetical protein LBM04_02690, partial [Opitutaceae bacterium]|nr:hypothetical protein [Opitutaceae bacterium]
MKKNEPPAACDMRQAKQAWQPALRARRGQREGHSVPGSAGIFARDAFSRDTKQAHDVSRAEMPALPGTAGYVTSVSPSSAVQEVRLLTDKGLTFFLLRFRHYIADEARAGGQA